MRKREKEGRKGYGNVRNVCREFLRGFCCFFFCLNSGGLVSKFGYDVRLLERLKNGDMEVIVSLNSL
jgi:hypothetical protein